MIRVRTSLRWLLLLLLVLALCLAGARWWLRTEFEARVEELEFAWVVGREP